MRCVYKVKSLLALRILCTGSEDSHRGGGRISQPSLFSAASSLRSQTSLQMAWETHMQALLQKWISESALGKKRNLFAGFIFLGWFIWQGPILYIILEFQNLFYLQRSLLKKKKKQRKNKRETMYVTPHAMLSKLWALPFYFLTPRLHRQQNRGWAELHPIMWESDLHY